MPKTDHYVTPKLSKPVETAYDALHKKGAILVQTDPDNKKHKIYMQQDKKSCPAASLRMLNISVGNKDQSEQYFRSLLDGSATHNSLITSNQDWTTVGADVNQILAALDQLRPKLNYHHDQNLTATEFDYLKQASPKKPILAGIQWTVGTGMHLILVVGKLKATDKKGQSQILAYDSALGLQVLKYDNASPSPKIYEPVDDKGKIVASGVVCEMIRIL